MTEASEFSPLLGNPSREQKNQKYCSCNVKYRLALITEKGAIVMIVCNLLVLTAVFAEMQRMLLNTNATISVSVISIITYPVAGIVADTCVGKDTGIQASILLATLSSLFNIIAILLQDYLPTTAETVCMLCTAVLRFHWFQFLCGLCLSFGCNCRPVDRSIWRTA